MKDNTLMVCMVVLVLFVLVSNNKRREAYPMCTLDVSNNYCHILNVASKADGTN